jgi:hypothetical protein
VRFQDGLLGAFNFNQPGMRGGGDPVAEQDLGQIEAALPVPEILVESKKSAVFSPGHTEFGGADEAAYMNDLMEKSECPAYALDGPYYDGKATLQRFRNMSLYGMTAVAAHGDSYFKQMTEEAKKGYEWHHKGSQELIWTGDAVDCTKLVQSTPSCSGPGTCPEGSECIIQTASQTSVSGLCVDMKQVDLRRGRAVFGPDTYGIVPSFVSHYRGRGMPNSMVYLGSCRSMWNGTFGMEFFAAGAKAVLGYSGYVSSAFAYEQATKFLSGLVEEFKLTGDAFPQPAPEDPSNPGTTLRLLGATNLNVTNSDLINPSWEKGDLTGWEKAGDGRVIARLGITVPVEGKFMGVISTGMGYTPQTGEISQMFCIPSDKVEMCFFWKFYSEEFVEWCGSIFQDTFEATLEGEEGTITSVSASVDDLCPPEQCMGCGGQYDGLIQSDVVFDVGDVWNTHWRKACTNIMALAGQGAVTLRFFCTDKGDSIYDTVVLIDAVKFK